MLNKQILTEVAAYPLSTTIYLNRQYNRPSNQFHRTNSIIDLHHRGIQYGVKL
ncbi:hypothetical protein LQV63_31215 [Paenibacillus profundus]|uniref:Uncharacterized protein n=1 Tax=Paenibacillus profundus TaxID=1173085 RepID=A0ABS8YQU9_9BACL|nr:hypothetical protein [Paenibacillus profundus]